MTASEKLATEKYEEAIKGSEILEGEYRGNAMMVIRVNQYDKFPFQFGIKKARLMVKYMKEIEEFAKRPVPAVL